MRETFGMGRRGRSEPPSTAPSTPPPRPATRQGDRGAATKESAPMAGSKSVGKALSGKTGGGAWTRRRQQTATELSSSSFAAASDASDAVEEDEDVKSEQRRKEEGGREGGRGKAIAAQTELNLNTPINSTPNHFPSLNFPIFL